MRLVFLTTGASRATMASRISALMREDCALARVMASRSSRAIKFIVLQSVRENDADQTVHRRRCQRLPHDRAHTPFFYITEAERADTLAGMPVDAESSAVGNHAFAAAEKNIGTGGKADAAAGRLEHHDAFIQSWRRTCCSPSLNVFIRVSSISPSIIRTHWLPAA